MKRTIRFSCIALALIMVLSFAGAGIAAAGTVAGAPKAAQAAKAPQAAQAPQPSPFDAALGEMHVYFGNLHSHTKVSDGKGSPEEAFRWARDTAGYDFYAVTDHDVQIRPSEWDDMGAQADRYNQDGSFVALRGFEWSNPVMGHICVWNTPKRTSCITKPTMISIYRWIRDNGGVAEFNHPGREFGMFLGFLFYNNSLANSMVGCETGNKGDGNVQNEFFGNYVKALKNGWRVAPTSNQDNHSLSTNSHRTAIVAPDLSRASLMDALKARRVYSTDDPNMQVVFRQGSAWMGSEVAGGGRKQFTVMVRDDETISKVELLNKSGDVLASYSPGTSEVVWGPTVDVAAGSACLVRITESDTRNDEGNGGGVQIAYSAPIWFR